jgi:hypothetical protein
MYLLKGKEPVLEKELEGTQILIERLFFVHQTIHQTQVVFVHCQPENKKHLHLGQ